MAPAGVGTPGVGSPPSRAVRAGPPADVLDSPSVRERLDALAHLERLDSGERRVALERRGAALLRIVRDSEEAPAARLAAVRLLGELPPDELPPGAIAAVVQRLDDAHTPLRAEALQFLETLGGAPACRASEAVVRRCVDPAEEPELRLAAVRVLGALDPEALDRALEAEGLEPVGALDGDAARASRVLSALAAATRAAGKSTLAAGKSGIRRMSLTAMSRGEAGHSPRRPPPAPATPAPTTPVLATPASVPVTDGTATSAAAAAPQEPSSPTSHPDEDSDQEERPTAEPAPAPARRSSLQYLRSAASGARQAASAAVEGAKRRASVIRESARQDIPPPPPPPPPPLTDDDSPSDGLSDGADSLRRANAPSPFTLKNLDTGELLALAPPPAEAEGGTATAHTGS
jgi:hypothetical protein